MYRKPHSRCSEENFEFEVFEERRSRRRVFSYRLTHRLIVDPVMRDSYRAQPLQLWTGVVVPHPPKRNESKAVSVNLFTKTCSILGNCAVRRAGTHLAAGSMAPNTHVVST